MAEKKVRIGTRGSQLALYQANKVKELLEGYWTNLTCSIHIIQTKGDAILDVPLADIGDKGLFTKEIETALFHNEIDLAVHSLKDLPSEFPKGLYLSGVLPRGEVRDVFISKNHIPLNQFTQEHTIGTSSLRRKAQLLHYNPMLRIVDIRGNVDTRIKKMEGGYCDAILLAGAGVERLGFTPKITDYLSPELVIPAASQGIIGIESREGDAETTKLISKINDATTYAYALAERAFLKTLEGGCQVPMGCYTTLTAQSIKMVGFVAATDGSTLIKEEIISPIKSNAEEILPQLMEETGHLLAQRILAKGGKQFVQFAR